VPQWLDIIFPLNLRLIFQIKKIFWIITKLTLQA